LIADRDNLVGALKPLKDTLVRFGILTDDTDADVEFSVEQEIDRGNPRVEIEVI
jgi:Holliday junction resolvase RusA-like endonuclease